MPVNNSNRPARKSTIFEYTGKTGLSVRGSITGNMYRFNFTGDKVIIDAKDADFMTAIPNLKKHA